MPDPHTHLLEVEVRVPSVAGAVELVMPSWTPGSYLMREFPRHVQDFSAHDDAARPLAWRKTDKNTWRVEAGAARAVTARYRVYANELSVRTSHLGATHASVNGASVFMFARGREREPLELEVVAPAGWRADTALDEVAPGRFRAAHYDELVDSPLEVGTHRTLEWEQEGVPHRFAIWGPGSYDGERLVADTRRIIETARSMFGSLPYRRYLFIVHLLPEGRGGLEHASSTMLQAGRGFAVGEEYESFLALVAHEFFHVWNAKRIRPAPLGPFDYTRENYTRNLWVVEGLTTYYTDLILRRAGLMSAERYLARLSESIARYMALPGRHHQSLADSSFDTWIKFYRPDEHTPSSQVSYYHKGALVGLLLDMEIRRATGNRRSLDDVMRLLWERYGAHDTGFPEEMRDGIQAVAEEVCGAPLERFFAAYVYSTEELDFDAALEVAGLRLDASPQPPSRDGGGATAAATPTQATDAGTIESRLGIRTRDQAGRARVVTVLEGTAGHRAGLNAGDEIVAMDGLRVAHAELAARLRGRAEGEAVELALFRRDQLLALSVPLGPHPAPKRVIRPVEAPSAAQAAVLRGWLALDDAGAPAGVDRGARAG